MTFSGFLLVDLACSPSACVGFHKVVCFHTVQIMDVDRRPSTSPVNAVIPQKCIHIFFTL